MPKNGSLNLHCCQQRKAHAFSILIPKYFYQIKCFYNNLSEMCYLILNFSDNCWSLASFYIDFVTVLFSVNIFLIMLKIQKPCHHFKLSGLTAFIVSKTEPLNYPQKYSYLFMWFWKISSLGFRILLTERLNTLQKSWSPFWTNSSYSKKTSLLPVSEWISTHVCYCTVDREDVSTSVAFMPRTGLVTSRTDRLQL